MEKYKGVIIGNVIAFAGLGLLMSVFGLAGVGAAGVVLGGLNLLIALLFGLGKNATQAKGCLLCGGILLLIGFSLCSAFTLNLH
jgi:hypothetical protein